MAAQACGYISAGTIEFLVDENLNYYFLEMNTRLQVEHAVTEQVTGIDLVKLQVRIADGEKLPWTQDEISFRGHSIEARLCAEDVRENFFPSTGRISRYIPSQGFGIREDSGIEQGSEITIHYDPMFAKLIVWGMDRNDAIAKMKRALDEYRIVGVETTIPFCRFVMDHPKFIEGDFQIDFIERHYSPTMLPPPSEAELTAAVLAAIYFQNMSSPIASNGNGKADARSRWTLQRAEAFR